MKYWSEKRSKVIEMFFGAETLNVETATSVAELFVKCLRERNIDISNLVNINTDSCSVLRGKKTGALKQISEFSPSILNTDIGGDILHHFHNANKKAFSEVFSNLDVLLKCIKYDIRSSPAKIEHYLQSCQEVGEKENMPVSYCLSRFLDRFRAIEDTLKHLESFKHYYNTCPDSKPRKKAVDVSEDDSDFDLDSSDSDGEFNVKRVAVVGSQKSQSEFRGNPSARVQFLKRSFLHSKVALNNELELSVARECMKPIYDFLRIFQSQEVKIHLLYEGMKEILRNILLEIVEPSSI